LIMLVNPTLYCFSFTKISIKRKKMEKSMSRCGQRGRASPPNLYTNS
jgi:hypothetical protein